MLKHCMFNRPVLYVKNKKRGCNLYLPMVCTRSTFKSIVFARESYLVDVIDFLLRRRPYTIILANADRTP